MGTSDAEPLFPCNTKLDEGRRAAQRASINPNRKVPALVDGDVTVFDSHAILLYLAEKHGAFIPTAVAVRARMLSWLQMVATGLSPLSGQAIHFLRYAPIDIPYARERYVKELLRHYRVLDARLSEAEWLAGDNYTIADMALWGWLASAGFIFGENALNDYPSLQRFIDTMAKRPAVQRALALKSSHAFKHAVDNETREALFVHR